MRRPCSSTEEYVHAPLRRLHALTISPALPPVSRRASVSGAAALAGTSTPAQNTSLAATPLASSVPTDKEQGLFLFVQAASAATFAENTDASYSAEYLLTMKGHIGGKVSFTDRPERVFGEAPTQQFLDGLGFDPVNPPNAAIVTTNTDGTGDVLIVELTNPAYDAGTGELSYGASILQSYTGQGLAFAASQQQDPILAPTLGSTSLFIDDCPDLTDYVPAAHRVGHAAGRDRQSSRRTLWSVLALEGLQLRTLRRQQLRLLRQSLQPDVQHLQW